MRARRLWIAAAVLAIACGAPAERPSAPPPVPVAAVCSLPAEGPAVVRRDGAATLWVWNIEADPMLFEPGFPDDPGLVTFRRAVGGDDVAPPAPESPATSDAAEAELWRRERRNAELVYGGRVGEVRPIHCLESILFAHQHRRFSQIDQPTELIASILRRGDQVRIYLGAGDQMFPPKSVYGFDLVEADLAGGWQLEAILHNHTVHRDGDAVVLGTPSPSTSDVQLMRALVESLGVRRVLVTNGVHTADVPAEALERLESRE
jgi:hypothetical protein